MDNLKNIRWMPILYIALTIWLLLWIWYKAALSFQTPEEKVRSASLKYPGMEKEVKPDPPGTYTLGLNQVISIRKSKFTYAGSIGDTLIIDVINLELDPQTIYRNKLSQRTARMSFNLSGHYYKLIKSGKNQIKIADLY